MKRTSETETELLPEYDFRQLEVVERGPGRVHPRGATVQLAPDVAAAFPDAASVNEALRMLMKVARSHPGRIEANAPAAG